MHEIFKTEAVVLSKSEVKEYDCFYSLLARNFGKIEAFAKSSRKPSAKLSSSLEPGSVVNCSFVSRKSDYMLVGAELLFRPSFLGLDSKTNALILSSLRVTRRIIVDDPREADEIVKLYEIMSLYLKEMADGHLPTERKLILQAWYYLNLLDYAGLRPLLRQCSLCGKNLEPSDRLSYDPSGGGVSCCISNPSGRLSVSFNAVKLVNYLSDAPYQAITRLSIDTTVINEAWKLARNHLKYCMS